MRKRPATRGTPTSARWTLEVPGSLHDPIQLCTRHAHQTLQIQIPRSARQGPGTLEVPNTNAGTPVLRDSPGPHSSDILAAQPKWTHRALPSALKPKWTQHAGWTEPNRRGQMNPVGRANCKLGSSRVDAKPRTTSRARKSRAIPSAISQELKGATRYDLQVFCGCQEDWPLRVMAQSILKSHCAQLEGLSVRADSLPLHWRQNTQPKWVTPVPKES